MTEPLTISARVAGGWAEVESCAGWSAFRAELALHDVGTWTLTLPLTHAAIAVLRERGSGIVARRPGAARPVVSGWVTDRRVRMTTDADGVSVLTAEISGVTDDLVLAGTGAYATPAVDVSASALTPLWPTQDTRTGTAAVILRDLIGANRGASALARRRLSWLDVAVSTAALTAGPSFTDWPVTRGRPLLDVASDLHDRTDGAVVVRVLQADTEDGLIAHIETPQDRLDVAWPLTDLEAGVAEAVTDEILAEVKSSAGAPSWVRRQRAGALPLPFARELLVEADGTAAEALAEADAQLARDAEAATGTLSGVDTPSARFGVHYDLGSRVALGLPEQVAQALHLDVPELVQVVTAATLEHGGGDGELTVTRTLGRDDTDTPDRYADRVARDLTTWLRRA